MAAAAEGEVEAVVHQALGLAARADAGALEELDGAAFEHARANAREHVLLRTALENDGVDARAMQQLAEEQPGRSGSDDRDLDPHCSILRAQSDTNSGSEPDLVHAYA